MNDFRQSSEKLLQCRCLLFMRHCGKRQSAKKWARLNPCRCHGDLPMMTRLDKEFSVKGGKLMGEFVMELWAFMKERKEFWLLPILVMPLLFGALIVLTQGSAVAPFIYTLF